MRVAARCLGVAACLAASLSLAGGEVLKPGSTDSLPLAQAQGGARAAALGNAGVALDDSAEALLWNPAALAGSSRPWLAAHGLAGLEGMTQGLYTVGVPLGWLGGFGANLGFGNSGAMEGRDEAGRRVEDYEASQVSGGLGWGKRWLPALSAGLGLRVSRLTLADKSYSHVAADLGALWRPLEPLAIAATWADVAGGAGDLRGASGLRVGASTAFPSMKGNAMLLAVSGEFQHNGLGRLQAGLEDTLFSTLSLRLGWQQDLQDNALVGLSGFTAGLGATWNGLRLDWAWGAVGDLGDTQRLSLSYEFGPGAGLVPATRPVSEETVIVPRTVADPVRAESAPARGKPSQAAVVSVDDAAVAMEMAGLRRALQAQPNSPELWDKLGDLHKKRGELKDAQQCWMKSLKMNPDQAAVRAKLDEVQ